MSVATRLFDVLKEIKDTLVTKASTQYVDEQIAQVGGGLTAAQILAELKTVDGANSGLDADLLDGNHASAFAWASHAHDDRYYTETEIQSNTILTRKLGLAFNGEPTNNLGTPSFAEMALFDEQFNNKSAFYDITKLKFYTSSDGVVWTELTAFSDLNKRRFLGGDTDSQIEIPNLTPYFKVELENNGTYCYLNALYMYWSSDSHSSKVHIWKQKAIDDTWEQHTSSTTLVSSWPGHLFLPFGVVPYYTVANVGYYKKIAVVFTPTWSGDPVYGSRTIKLYRMQIWGGYPAGKRNLFSTDELQNVTYPAKIKAQQIESLIANGTAPLIVASGTKVANLNSDKLDDQEGSYYLARGNHTGTQSADTLVDGTTIKAYTATEKTKLAGIEAGANNYTHPASHSADIITDGSTNKAYTATEKTKLAGIEAGATADMTAAEMLTAIKTVDGSASGLDSDLLDAQHGSYYLARANHTGTQSADSLTDGSTNKAYTATEKTKLAGIGAVFVGYKNSTTAIANTTDVLIASDTTYENTDTSVYSLSGGLVTVLKAGTYLISSLASISSGSDNTRMLTIVYVNGAPIIYAGQNGQVLSKISRVVGTVALNLAANDTIGVYLYQDSGASKTCNAGINGNYINIAKIG